jgi:hypothetical protein
MSVFLSVRFQVKGEPWLDSEDGSQSASAEQLSKSSIWTRFCQSCVGESRTGMCACLPRPAMPRRSLAVCRQTSPEWQWQQCVLYGVGRGSFARRHAGQICLDGFSGAWQRGAGRALRPSASFVTSSATSARKDLCRQFCLSMEPHLADLHNSCQDSRAWIHSVL